MTIDRDPMCSKMIRVSDKVHDMLCQAKLIPQEPYNNCIERIVAENNYLKRHYLAEAPRESMYRELQHFVINPEIKDSIVGGTNEGHIKTWNETHPGDQLKQGEVIHHINGDHNDNRPENLSKMTQEEHGKEHKSLNDNNNVSKIHATKTEITFEPPKKIM